MKSINLILAPLLAVATAGNAQTKNDFVYALKEVKLEHFSELSIKAGLDVVFVENPRSQTVFLEGDERLIKEIQVSVKDGRLIIDGAKDHSYRGKLQVTVVVNQLNRIQVDGKGTVAWSTASAAKAISKN